MADQSHVILFILNIYAVIYIFCESVKVASCSFAIKCILTALVADTMLIFAYTCTR